MDGLAASSAVNVQDVYTDINSLNKLKTENSDVALKKVAQEFESIFINIMLKSMRDANAVFEEDSLFQSNESKMYRDMYDQQLALSLSKGKGLGIADVLYRQLQGQYGELAQAHDNSVITQGAKATESGAALVPPVPKASLRYSNTAAPVRTSKESEPVRTETFENQQSFVDNLLPIAKTAVTGTGLNPVLMLAQAALETGWGQHLVKSGKEFSYNLFNIKADASWGGESVAKTTLEYKDGIAVKEAAKFRKYDSFDQSLQDFVSFLNDNPRYKTALECTDNDQQFIKELHQAGYATDPDYSTKVLSVYQRLQSMLANAE